MSPEEYEALAASRAAVLVGQPALTLEERHVDALERIAESLVLISESLAQISDVVKGFTL